MKITVTQNDMDNGIREDDLLNPVSLALSRELGYKFVSVGSLEICYSNQSVFTEYVSDVPDGVLEWLDSYDNGEDVLPFSFSLGELFEVVANED